MIGTLDNFIYALYQELDSGYKYWPLAAMAVTLDNSTEL